MKFACIGFDLRKWPWDGQFNVDETGWETNDAVLSNVVSKFKLAENEYELLLIENDDLLDQVCDYIDAKFNCKLVAIEMQLSRVAMHDKQYGYSTSDINLSLSRFEGLGLDICDFNGLFSALHNPLVGGNSSKLISLENFDHALECVGLANDIDPDHAPFVVCKISKMIT